MTPPTTSRFGEAEFSGRLFHIRFSYVYAMIPVTISLVVSM